MATLHSIGSGARCGRWWAAALLAIMAAPTSARAQIDAGIEGTYLFAGGAAERAAHDLALEDAAKTARPVARPLVRAFLRKYLAIPRTIAFERRGDLLSIALHPFPARTGRLDGSVTYYKNGLGQRVALHRTVEGATIVEHADQGRNTRCVRYSFAPGAKRLVVSMSFSAPAHIETPIRYSLSFKRQ